MSKGATRIILPNGEHAKNSRGPVGHNVIVKRGVEEGGFDGVSELTGGVAWHAPNFRTPASKRVPAPGERYHVVAQDTKIIVKNSSWSGFLGLEVVAGDGMRYDKSEIAVFMQHKNGGWAAAAAVRQWYLLACMENNDPDHGKRVDEFVIRSLSLAGLPAGNSNKRSMGNAIETVFGTYASIVFSPGAKARICTAMENEFVKRFGTSNFDSARYYNPEDGTVAGEYTETFDGKIKTEL